MENVRTRTLELDVAAVARREFMVRVYGWMAAGLTMTGLVANYVANSPEIIRAIYGTGGVWGVFLVQLGLAFALSGSLRSFSSWVASLLFFLYSVVTGVALCYIFLVYTRASVHSAFLVTAGTFAGMSIYGAVTKKDLTSWGSFLYMAVWGLFLASLANIFFLQSAGLYSFITYGGVLVFTGLTAYDTQKILEAYDAGSSDGESRSRLVIRGAFELYLDFVILFVYLLRLLGSRRD